MRDRGSALLTTVIAITVLALISGTFFALSASRSRMDSAYINGLKASSLAVSGIQFGVAHLYQSSEIPEEPVIQENPFGTDYGGRFTVVWEDNANFVLIRSTGYYQGVTRIREAKFTDHLVSEKEIVE